jgi:hypothetical protein
MRHCVRRNIQHKKMKTHSDSVAVYSGHYPVVYRTECAVGGIGSGIRGEPLVVIHDGKLVPRLSIPVGQHGRRGVAWIGESRVARSLDRGSTALRRSI